MVFKTIENWVFVLYVLFLNLLRRIFAVGGYEEGRTSCSVETYDVRMKYWMEIPSLTRPRDKPICLTIGDGFFS